MADLVKENLALQNEEIAAGKTVLKSLPRSLRVVLTSRCNINCIMCQIQRWKQYTLPYDLVAQIKEFLPRLERIDWQGGEVLTVAHFRRIFDEVAAQPHVLQTIQTNGTTLSDSWIEALARANAHVLVSVDSTKKETYEYIRKGASFDRLLNRLEAYRGAVEKAGSRNERTLCPCILRSNYREVLDFVDFAARYGFARLSLGFLHGDLVPHEDIFSPRDPEAIAFLRQTMPEVEARCREKNIILTCSFKSFLEESATISAAAPQETAPRRPFCVMPWTNLVIDAIRYGNVYPECLCARPIGNIRQHRLRDLWNSRIMQEYRREFAADRAPMFCPQPCVQSRPPRQ